MSTHRVRGTTIVFKFSDGPMKAKAFAHVFHEDGSLEFGMPAGDGKKTHVKKYELAEIGDSVRAVSYLSDAGYTLTTILDFATHRLVAFSSNEKELGVQHGSFEVAK